MEEKKTEMTAEDIQKQLDDSNAKILDSLDEKFQKVDEKIAGIIVTPSQKDIDAVDKGGFDNIGDFAKSVFNARSGLDTKMKDWNDIHQKTFNEGVQSEGGFTVPPQFSNTLWQRGIELSNFFSKAFDIPITGNEYHQAALVDESHASNLYGGVIMYYKKEEEQYTATYAKFRDVEWRLNKLTGMTKISDELLEDSNQNMSAVISQLFSNAIAWRIDKDMLVGTGVGQPLGILDAPAKVEVAIETGQDTNEPIKYENLVKMLARLWGNKGEWICSKTMFPYLATMTIVGGTASVPVWIPGNDASKAPNGTILGKTLNYSEHCKAANTTGDIYLVDWSQYGVAHKNNGGIKTATSMHLYFDYDQMAFKIKFRWDGQSMWNSAFQPANGDTLSPFITLGTRS